MDDLKTFRQWTRDGRAIRKGEKAEQYLLNDDMTSGRGLFRRDQTELAEQADISETEGWTIVVPVEEWEVIKADLRATQRGPTVKVRAAGGGGTEVWCGPNKVLIGWLKDAGYRYDPKTRYWHHPNKEPKQIAEAFHDARVEGRKIKVSCDVGVYGPVPEGI